MKGRGERETEGVNRKGGEGKAKGSQERGRRKGWRTREEWGGGVGGGEGRKVEKREGVKVGREEERRKQRE